MPGTGRAEIYFITAMMVLIMVLSVAAVIIFFKTYKKEMREKEDLRAKKEGPLSAGSAEKSTGNKSNDA